MSAPVDVRPLLADAACWRMLSLLLECPRAGWRQKVASLLPEVGGPRLALAARAALGDVSEGAYHRALGPGGAVSPREVAHAPLALPGILLGDVAAYYDAFLFRPASEEPPDHVSVEAGFLGYLRVKEAYALASGDGDNAATVRRAADAFAAGHLAQQAEPIARGLAAAGAPDYLVRSAEALAARLGPPPLPTRRSTPDPDDADAAFGCGVPGA